MRIKSVSATSYFILIFVLAPNLSSSTAAARLENNEVEKRKSSAEKAGFKSNWVFQLARIADTLVTEEEQDEMDMLGFSPKHLASLFFSSKQKQRSANRRQGRSFTVDPDRIYEGIFNPDNAFIYVGQRFVEFISTTIGFAIAAALYTNDQDNNNSIRSNRLQVSSGQDASRGENAEEFIAGLSDNDLGLLLDLEEKQPNLVKRLSGSGQPVQVQMLRQQLDQRQRENQHILRPVSFEFKKKRK